MFRNDYSELAAPEVMEHLAEYAGTQIVGYGLDEHSARAAEYILRDFGLTKDEAEVHFVLGGTQANMVAISYFLRPYEGVISCDTAHINGHETGAVEGSGHKILTVKNTDGKILPADIDGIMAEYNNEHLVHPAMVYITEAAENGMVYTNAELDVLRETCDKYDLLLYLDGARLGVALTCGADVTAEHIAKVCDAFYVGGTKNGAMIGEAIVLKKNVIPGYFRNQIKNRGAMIGKGYLLGLEFEALFKDGLYYRLAKNSNDMAAYIKKGIEDKVEFTSDSPTNQLFIRVSRSIAPELIEKYGLEIWTEEADTQVLRIVTSFATKKEDAEEFIEYIRKTF